MAFRLIRITLAVKSAILNPFCTEIEVFEVFQQDPRRQTVQLPQVSFNSWVDFFSEIHLTVAYSTFSIANSCNLTSRHHLRSMVEFNKRKKG